MSVFGRGYSEAYDTLYGDKDYSGECDALESLLAKFSNVTPVRRLLDLGCGTGGHAVPLARRGYLVTGVDRSPTMLARAGENAAEAGIRNLSFHEGDIQTVRLDDAPYDAAIMMFAVLGYQQADDEIHAALATARAHLGVGSVLVLDVWNGAGVLSDPPGLRERTVDIPSGRIARKAEGMIDRNRHVCAVRYELSRWEGHRLAEVTREEHFMRYFFRDEIERFAVACGFICRAYLRWPDWHAPADDKAWTAVAVLQAI